MKKIMFNDRYGLTRKVLSGYKTQTRRVIPDIEIDWVRRGKVHLPVGGYEHGVLFMDVRSILHDAGISDYVAPAKYQPKYEEGEEVAIAQSYETLANSRYFSELGMMDTPTTFKKEFCGKGWGNKMFVRADLMPHRIRITNIKAERLQDISEEDCLREGIMEGEFMNTWDRFYFDSWGDVPNHITFRTPRAAFAALIDKVSGKGTWERNPWVFVYEFELVK